MNNPIQMQVESHSSSSPPDQSARSNLMHNPNHTFADDIREQTNSQNRAALDIETSNINGFNENEQSMR